MRFLSILLIFICSFLNAQNLQDRVIKSSYTSVLISAKLNGTQDYPAFDRGQPTNKGTKLDRWFYEPLKDRHYLKLIGGQGRTFYAHLKGEDCLRVSILNYEKPVTKFPVVVRTEQEFIQAFDNLKSDTTVLIMPGTYRIQQEKLTQHVFTNLENVKILGRGAIISGFKTDDNVDGLFSHQIQAFGLKDDIWKRMNPRDARGPGAAIPSSTEWTDEALFNSELLGFRIGMDGKMKHNANEVKISNFKSPNLWKFTHCKNFLIQDLTFTGYNSVYPNTSALGCIAEIQGCENFKFQNCTFDRNGGAIVSALNTQKICNLIWFNQCKVIDENDEFPYLAIRHAGNIRAAGTIYFNNTQNCSITNTEFINVFMPILDINGINNDYADNYFERCRNICISAHGLTGYGLSVWRNKFFKCGNPLPSNEELGQFGPSFWFNNSATESGWNGTQQVLKLKGTSGGVSQGNRLGGSSTLKQLGGIHLYDNQIEVAGIQDSADIITTVGLQLANHAFSRLDVDGNTWRLTNTGARTANVVRHFEVGGKTEHLLNNVKTITWKNNTLEWDRPDDKVVFFGMKNLTNQEFENLLKAGKQ